MTAIRKPTCLHIPRLREGHPARIAWESVEGAQGYQLDMHFDETFDAASTGKTWSNINTADRNWSQIGASSLTWEQIETLGTRGLRWKNIEFRSKDWHGIQASGLSWAQLQSLPVEFTVYRGPGGKVRGPDQGLTWANMQSAQLPWAEIEAREKSWEDFKFLPSVGISWRQFIGKLLGWGEIEAKDKTWRDFELMAVRGLMWESLNARFRTWAQVEARELTWRGFQTLPADSNTHIAHTVDIPLLKRKAIFRVRAFDDDGFSEHLTSSLQRIIPLFYREDSIRFPVKSGGSYLVPVYARGVEDFREIIMTLKYDSAALQIERLAAELPGGKTDTVGDEHTSNACVVLQEAGRLSFRCSRRMRAGQKWDGLVVALLFRALQCGYTDISLS